MCGHLSSLSTNLFSKETFVDWKLENPLPSVRIKWAHQLKAGFDGQITFIFDPFPS